MQHCITFTAGNVVQTLYRAAVSNALASKYRYLLLNVPEEFIRKTLETEHTSYDVITKRLLRITNSRSASVEITEKFSENYVRKSRRGDSRNLESLSSSLLLREIVAFTQSSCFPVRKYSAGSSGLFAVCSSSRSRKRQCSSKSNRATSCLSVFRSWHTRQSRERGANLNWARNCLDTEPSQK